MPFIPDDTPSTGKFIPDNGMTGNPTIDMASANQEQAKAEQGVRDVNRPFGALDKVYGYPYTTPKVLANNIGGIVNTLTHPVDTSMALLKSATHPVDALSNYLGRYSPDNIKNTISTDPIGVMLDATMVGGLATSGIKAIPRATPEDMIAKAEGITQRILNPAKQDIADAILKKSQIPAVREAAKVIKQSPDEKSLLNNIDNAINTNFTERQSIFESNNFKMTDNYIKQLEDFKSKRLAEGQISDAEVRQIDNVLSEEKAWYVKNQDNFDRIGGQDRKEVLQRKSQPLLEAEKKGANTEDSRFRMQALDQLRNGLMKEVEGNDPRVANLNSTYAGLKDAKEMLANQAAIIQQNAHKGTVERLLLMAQSATSPQAAAINVALNNAKNISKLSGKVESLMQKATKNKVNRVIEDAMNQESGNPILGLPDLTPQYLKDRINSNPGSLGTKTGPMKNRPFQIGGIELPESQTVPYTPSQIRKKSRDLNLENPNADKKAIFDESYKNAIAAKLKRMINFGK